MSIKCTSGDTCEGVSGDDQMIRVLNPLMDSKSE
jgi:hypothetical protein